MSFIRKVKYNNLVATRYLKRSLDTFIFEKMGILLLITLAGYGLLSALSSLI